MGEYTVKCLLKTSQTSVDRFEEIYKVVKDIPQGKVAAYGQIAELVGTSPRVVGQAMHKNPDPGKIPCHRVVTKDGRIAEKFASGGWREQRRRLLAEGVKFKSGLHVDLQKHLWRS